MATTTPYWTKPYFGVSHLQVKGRYQITLNDFGHGKAEAYLLNLNSSTPFTPIKEFYGDVKVARTEAEWWARELSILK